MDLLVVVEGLEFALQVNTELLHSKKFRIQSKLYTCECLFCYLSYNSYRRCTIKFVWRRASGSVWSLISNVTLNPCLTEVVNLID